MHIQPADYSAIGDALARITAEAGKLILEIYATDFEARTKDEGSPVTEADEKAEVFILEQLRALAPDVPVVAEESAAAGNLPEGKLDEFFLVDPLDGTKEFISRNGEFTVNIALIQNGKPVLGAVHLPAKNETFWTRDPKTALLQDSEGTVKPLSCRAAPADGLVVVASRSHRDDATNALLEKLDVKELIGVGSSLKLCVLARGDADFYPRTGRTMEWDIGAGHAVLTAAGGQVLTMDGSPLGYGKLERGYDNPAFLAIGAGAPGDYGIS